MFKREKYKKCIGHLVFAKFCRVALCTLLGAFIGATSIISILSSTYMKLVTNTGNGYEESIKSLISTATIGGIVGAILGTIIGIFLAWRLEMKIQEAYWRIDVLDELKLMNSNKVVYQTQTSTTQKAENKTNTDTEKNDE